MERSRHGPEERSITGKQEDYRSDGEDHSDRDTTGRLEDDVIEETECRADGDERRGEKTSQEPEDGRSNGETL